MAQYQATKIKTAADEDFDETETSSEDSGDEGVDVGLDENAKKVDDTTDSEE